MILLQIYNQPPNPTLTIDEVLELLKKFQDSAVQREREVFSCMIKNLFEEYKYFPQVNDISFYRQVDKMKGCIG